MLRALIPSPSLNKKWGIVYSVKKEVPWYNSALSQSNTVMYSEQRPLKVPFIKDVTKIIKWQDREEEFVF